jgi:NAD(P)-dependent dehydrogenase (short-subunit alcohol dehydrogenase family)
VSKKATAHALVEAAVEAYGAIDILVNNAGVTHAASSSTSTRPTSTACSRST